MAVAMSHEIRAAELPVYCSSCFGQYPERKHIEFAAACDRGWYGNDPATHVVMDDLILCENCVAEASRLLGWMPVSEVQSRIASLEHSLEIQTRERQREAEYSARMEDALRHRPAGDPVDHRARRRKREDQNDR